jgi:hypothetical protein
MPLATWNGPFDALLPTMTVLRVGEPHEVSDSELRSGHWKRVRAPKPETAPTTEKVAD